MHRKLLRAMVGGGDSRSPSQQVFPPGNASSLLMILLIILIREDTLVMVLARRKQQPEGNPVRLHSLTKRKQGGGAYSVSQWIQTEDTYGKLLQLEKKN